MSDLEDTGFDDVLAGGAVWTEPDTSNVTGPNAITIEPAPAVPLSPHVCKSSSGDRCDTCFGPVPASDAPEKIQAPLTAEAIEATKILVTLPPLSYADLAILAREVAMDIRVRNEVLSGFNLNETQYEYLETHNEFYKHALKTACVEWHSPLSSQERVRLVASTILEETLPRLGARMHNDREQLPGVVEAAKLFAKMAGVGERDTGAAPAGERFVINIDLGGNKKIVVGAEAPKAIAAGIDTSGAQGGVWPTQFELPEVQPDPEGKS